MPVNSLSITEITELGKKLILPSSVLIEVCYSCNEKCVHCFLNEHKSTGLSLEQYGKIFDDMVSAGTFFVILTGGDPFMRKDFLEIVEAARKRRISVTIFTNATLIGDYEIERLRALWVETIHVSIYSADPSIHDQITRVPGSFYKSLAAISKMLDNGICVRLKCPLMKQNADGIEDLKEFARKLGVTIQFTAVITARNDGNTQTHNCRVTPEQLSVAVSDKDVLSQSSTPVHFRENLDAIPCETVFNGGAIDPLGNVYLCNQLQVIGGNVTQQSLLDIWRNSEAFKKIRNIRVRDLQKCSECNIFSFCSRCPGLADLEDGDILGCSSVAKLLAEERHKVGIYPAETHIFSRAVTMKGGD